MTATSKQPRTKLAATKPAAANAVPSGEMDSFDQICSIRIELLHTDPLIWREVEVPTSITLKVLHDVIQISMGWLDCHLWEFTIDRRSYGLPMPDLWGAPPRLAALKVRLREVLKRRPEAPDNRAALSENQKSMSYQPP